MDIPTRRVVLNNLQELEFNVQLFVMIADFLDTVMTPSTVRQKFMSCMFKILGIEFGHSCEAHIHSYTIIYQFNVHSLY